MSLSHPTFFPAETGDSFSQGYSSWVLRLSTQSHLVLVYECMELFVHSHMYAFMACTSLGPFIMRYVRYLLCNNVIHCFKI